MSETVHLTLPYIAAAQAQKHVTHNEALRILDALVMLAVKDRDLSAPPGSPSDGDRYLVKATGSGAFAGKDAQIAEYRDAAWTFHAPRAGWICYVEDEDAVLIHTGFAWTLRHPTSSTDNAIVRFDGAAGRLQNSGVTVGDENQVSGVSVITGTTVTISNNAATFLQMPALITSCLLMMAMGNAPSATQICGSVHCRFTATVVATPLQLNDLTNVAFTTGPLTGTTGTSGKLTISIDGTDKRIYVENRLGAARGVGLTPICYF
jgi:hypothetical protein